MLIKAFSDESRRTRRQRLRGVKAIMNICELTTQCRPIILVDACDIFLEQRTTADIARNSMVSIE
jgi:hypothetical protein